MIPSRDHWVGAGVAFLVVISLPFLAAALRDPRPPSCDLDGVEIEPVYAVAATDVDGRTFRFCCVRCAERWLDVSARPVREVRVTDEIAGRPVASRKAWFVHSPLVTTPESGNRTRCFATEEAAREHVRRHGGHLLDGAERPFGRLAEPPAAPGGRG